jgi:hypothetical protein
MTLTHICNKTPNGCSIRQTEDDNLKQPTKLERKQKKKNAYRTGRVSVFYFQEAAPAPLRPPGDGWFLAV